MAVGARGEVEERRLAAVRVAHEGHVDRAPLLHGDMLQVVVFVILRIERSCFVECGKATGRRALLGNGWSVEGDMLCGRISTWSILTPRSTLHTPRNDSTLHTPRIIAHHLDIVGLLVAQAHLVAHQLVLHGILQRGVQQHLHFLALDESHLDDPLAESTMPQHLHDDALLACLQFR